MTIRIAPSNREYKLSKALVCKHSPIFKATFEGSFREGVEQATTIDEEDGVVSLRSFGLLVQWMYLGQVGFGDLSPSESIGAAIEFSRIADMYGVTGMEETMASHIKSLVKTCPYPPKTYQFDKHTFLLESQHIASAVQLPHGHAVRRILAVASVRGYLKQSKHKFSKEVEELPGFASDLLDAVKSTLETFQSYDDRVKFTDPINEQTINMYG